MSLTIASARGAFVHKAAEEHINPIDAFTLNLERDPLLRATIVAIATFDETPGWADLVERIDRATRITPRFRERLLTVPFGLAPPRWVVDADFDLSLHLRRHRVHRGGGIDDVIEFARAAGLTEFDHNRPLWEFTLIDGLPQRKAALVMKLHHALTDGVGGIEIAAHVVDFRRDPSDLGPMPDAPVPTDHGLADLISDTADFHRRRLTDASGELIRAAARTVAHAVAHPADAAASSVTTARALTRFVRPATRTLSPIMTDRRALRSFDRLDIPLGPLRDAAHGTGCTVNDAFLAAIAGGMRRYHEHHYAILDHVCLNMPISTRGDNDGPGGNRVTLERFDLPIGITDPALRMIEIGRICREVQRDPAIPYGSVIATVLNLLPVGVTAGMLKHVDLLASNVPGFDREVFVAGARLDAFHVFGATLGSAANITLMSYRDTCHIGISTDIGAIHDPETFRTSMQDGFDEVIALTAC